MPIMHFWQNVQVRVEFYAGECANFQPHGGDALNIVLLRLPLDNFNGALAKRQLMHFRHSCGQIAGHDALRVVHPDS